MENQQKYSNLPIGAKITLTKEKRASLAKKMLYSVMNVTITDLTTNGYLVKELAGIIINYQDIALVIKYPINEKDLIIGNHIKIRDDLPSFTCSKSNEWKIVGTKHQGKIGKIIKVDNVVYLNFEDDEVLYWATFDMLEAIIKT